MQGKQMGSGEYKLTEAAVDGHIPTDFGNPASNSSR